MRSFQPDRREPPEPTSRHGRAHLHDLQAQTGNPDPRAGPRASGAPEKAADRELLQDEFPGDLDSRVHPTEAVGHDSQRGLWRRRRAVHSRVRLYGRRAARTLHQTFTSFSRHLDLIRRESATQKGGNSYAEADDPRPTLEPRGRDLCRRTRALARRSGPGHIGRGLRATRRHARDQGRIHALRGLHVHGLAHGEEHRRERLQPERVQRLARVHQHHRPASPPALVPNHAGHHARDRHRQLVERELHVRLKYGFGQFNMDDWLPKGSWARLGLQQTPYIDYAEGIYRYRFQSAIMVDRDGFLTSSDLGLSSHVNFPDNYGDVHVGIYNGEGYSKAEANDQKGFQVRASLRPLASVAIAKGWRITGFWNSDNVAKEQKRDRWLVDTTFEHPYVNLGFTYVEATNQASPGASEVKPRDFSIWVTPRTLFGLEALIRYDELKPNKDLEQKQKRTIVGIAYWFNFGHGIVSALMADYTQEKFDNFTPAKADNKFYALHTLFNF